MPTEKTRARRATTADLPDIVTLLEGAGLPLQGLGVTALWVGAMDESGSAVGVVGLEVHGDAGLLRSLAVQEAHRGAGIGHALVAHAIEEASARHLTSLYVVTVEARDFFAEIGFEEVDRDALPDALQASAELQGACPADAPVMMLALDR